jgi:serine/threonine protein kinase
MFIVGEVAESLVGQGENLLITEAFRCKLSDFGLSRSLERDSNANTMCGTPRWLAPEVFRGEDYSEKVDVYSYGIVLWELFCFRKPYMEHDPINMAYLVAHEDLRPPLLEHIPDMLQRLMAACWHADPAQRPAFSSVVFLIEEAKNAVPAALAVDQDKRFSDAAAAHQKLAKYPRKSYGLTSGML